MQIQPVYQSLSAGKHRLIVVPSLGHQRISQQTIPNRMHLVPPRRIQNGKIKPREEFLCIWLHHVPRRVAQHRIESTLAGPFMPEHFWEGQVPWQCLAPGGQHRFLPRGQSLRPGPRRRDRACQRQPFVIYSLRRQHHRTGPGTRQETQRLQRKVQPPLCRSLQCEIGGISTNRCLQRPNLMERRLQRLTQAGSSHPAPAAGPAPRDPQAASPAP